MDAEQLRSRLSDIADQFERMSAIAPESWLEEKEIGPEELNEIFQAASLFLRGATRLKSKEATQLLMLGAVITGAEKLK